MSNTVVFYNPYLGAPGFENVTFGPLNAPPNYEESYSGFQPDLVFSEAGNYTLFISYKDNLWGVDATAYAAMTIYVSVLDSG